MSVSIEKQAAGGKTSSNSLKNISPPGGSVEWAEGARISLSKIFPLPKETAGMKTGRSARRSDTMTCSSFKKSLLNVNKKGEQNIQLDLKRNSVMGLLLDGHLVQKRRRRRKSRIFSIQSVMGNMKGQLQETGYNA